MLLQDEIVIRTVKKEDLNLLHEWNSQKARGPYQESQFMSLVNINKDFEDNGFDSDKFKMLIIELQELQELQPIGLIYINFIREGLVRIGLVICEEKYRNGGFGLKATKMIARHLFDNYPIVRIEAETDNQNIGAQKVLERAGFKKEGVLRNYRYHHKEWRDFVIYSILNNEI